jgi:hypothetical protein
MPETEKDVRLSSHRFTLITSVRKCDKLPELVLGREGGRKR